MPLVCVQCRNSGGEDKALLEWMTLGCFFFRHRGSRRKGDAGCGYFVEPGNAGGVENGGLFV